ncbi:translation initiation factor IF-2 [Rhipicephalus sanguineus]|uniref:translation initiation factor IF-2 n=1 Tax=Rhipicephalus sanguineus TaxID=34632 RepID=UPI001894B532|nr:translation initiation factor IF-2 [Rhipicephalus sanguineus]
MTDDLAADDCEVVMQYDGTANSTLVLLEHHIDVLKTSATPASSSPSATGAAFDDTGPRGHERLPQPTVPAPQPPPASRAAPADQQPCPHPRRRTSPGTPATATSPRLEEGGARKEERESRDTAFERPTAAEVLAGSCPRLPPEPLPRRAAHGIAAGPGLQFPARAPASPGGGREGWRALLRNLGRSSNPVGQGHTLTDARQQLQTRAKPAPKTPAKPGRGATKASTRSKKEESEGEEAASVEEASTAAANEDGSADSKEKEDEEELRRWCHVCV